MSEKQMRELPRYIEERKMIGTMPAKNFLRLLPIWIILIVIVFRNTVLPVVFICMFSILILYLLFSEISRKYTVLDFLNDFIRYKREGDKYWERSAAHEPEYKKITCVEIDRPETKK